MAQYEQKTDSREFEVADPDQHPGPWSGDLPAEATDIAVRLWGPERSDRRVPLTWNADSVLVYMIADLVGASGGRIAEESLAVMAAHFDSSRQALVAAKRIQTSILAFLACRPGDRIGGAILIYPPRTTDPDGFSGEMVQQVLVQAKPGQILLTENVSQRLRDLPGIEFRAVPALTAGTGNGETALTELVWTTPERVALLQESVGKETEPQGGDSPPVGATLMVHSPFASQGPTSDTVPPVMGTDGFVVHDGSKTASLRSRQVSNQAPDRAPISEDFQGSPSNSLTEGLDEFGERPLITRTRVILGVVALVLVAAVIAVLYRPARVSHLPIPLQQDQTGATESPVKQPPVAAEPEANTAQPEPTTGKPQAKVQKPAADSRVKNKKQNSEEPAPSYDEFGGVSEKDIPRLLKMAQNDAGDGKYAKARREFQAILNVQHNNQDAKDGLRRLDLIKNDQQ